MNKEERKKKAEELLGMMTLSEKAGLCSGEDCWHLKSVKRLKLMPIAVMDGPHGLRKQTDAADNLGIGDSVPAVCFPTASAIACSFDRELVKDVGRAIGEECQKEHVSVILGPALNQKRNPLCGRNFEYYSEDAVVSGELAASMVEGIQSTGTGACLKHFAVNNQERHRMTVDAILDERTLRETYLKAFERAVKKGRPYLVMCSYNRINGVYASENKKLIDGILRKEWGFKGAVVSDWGAVHDRCDGIRAGLDLEMPGNHGYNDKKIIHAVKEKKLSMDALNRCACRIVELMLKVAEQKPYRENISLKRHHALAVHAAIQSAVLLKNEGGILPGGAGQDVAVIGELAAVPRYQGAGSSKIHPFQVDSPLGAFRKRGIQVTYAAGYRRKKQGGSKKEEERLKKEACEAAKGRDIVYIFAGLTEGYESEGFDRADMKLPVEQNRLIEEVARCSKNVVVILCGGAPVELPWVQKVKGILLTYLGGEGVGEAAVSLLLGEEVPSGKLAETWPVSLDDVPSRKYFPGGRLSVEYREGIYVGYRYYEKANVPVLFPFGHGMSYSKFSYSNLRLSKEEAGYGETVTLTFSITNTGKVKAKETAFVFFHATQASVFRPRKELLDFRKVELLPNEKKDVTVVLNTKEFSYYNIASGGWYAPPGTYELIVGASSADCTLFTSLTLRGKKQEERDLHRTAPAYYELKQGTFDVPQEQFEALLGRKLTQQKEVPSRPFTMENTMEDIKGTVIGSIVNRYADHIIRKAGETEEGQQGMMDASIKEMPFFSLVPSSDGMISDAMMEGILDMANGKYLRGMKKLLKRENKERP